MNVEFGPFEGYVSSMERWKAPRNKLVGPTDGSTTNGSLNMELDRSGLAFRRRGCGILGDTLVNGAEQAGLLPAKWGAKARRILSLPLSSPTYGTLYTKEEQSASFPAVDTGYFSNLYARIGSTNWTLLAEQGTNGYPTATGTEFMLKVEPLWYESGEGGYTRGTHEIARRFLVSGSRDVLAAGGDLFFPSLRGTPSRWNGKGNASSASVTERVRLGPNGPMPPLWGPTATAGSTTTNPKEVVYKEGDAGFFSVLFRYRDGSYSAPYLPTRSEVFVLGTPGGTTSYKSVELTNIPVGGPDVVARLILATEFVTLTATAGAVLTIEPGALRVIGLLDDNTRTSFSVTLRNPDEIPNNADIVRVDMTCPRRAAHLGTGDQRAIIGRTLPNQIAIQIAPASVNAAYDLNFPDDNTGLYGATRFVLRLTSTNLELFKTTGTGNAQDFVAPGNGLQLSLATYDTLQKLVDAVNATTTADLCGGWRAGVCPGVDPSKSSALLLPTTSSVAGCTTATSTTLTTSNSFADVAIGALVSGTDIPAGTYVKSKESATSITLSQAATGSTGGLTITFSFDLGDDYIMASTERGYMRCFGGSYRGFLYFKRSALPGYDRIDDNAVHFTLSSPGAAATGVSLAPRCWPADNKRSGPSSYGAFMGFADLEGMALCAWRNGLDMLVNVRGVNTGEDFDVRRMTVNRTEGCISWQSLASADGAAFYLTESGLKVTDKNRLEAVISQDIFDPTRRIGDLAEGVADCAESSTAGTDDMPVCCRVLGHRLALVASGRVLLYDFSAGLAASGLDAVVERASQRPYGWSPPSQFFSGLDGAAPTELVLSIIGSVDTSSGTRVIGASDSNAGTGDGRLEALYEGDSDNGAVFWGYAYTAEMIAPAFARLSPTRVEVVHNSHGSHNATFTLRHMRDRTDYTTYQSRTLASADVEVQQQEIPLSQTSQAPVRFLAFAYVAGATNFAALTESSGRGWWGMTVEAQQLDT